VSEPAGTIHDLGYKRYAGARQSTRTRWLVIARNQIATAWKTWWRFKLALGLAVIVTFVAGGVMFLLQDRTANGLALPSGIAATLTDAALPRAIEWYSRAACLFSLATGASIIARDVQSGAFTFYFARSVRPRDYVLGKLGGMLALNAALMLAGPLVLAIARLALSESTDQLIALLPIVPKTLAIGLLGTLAFAAVPLGFSALVRNPRYTMALWAVYYLAIGFMMIVLSRELKNGLAALDIPTALDGLTYDLFGMAQTWGRSKRVDPTLALTSLLAHSAAAIAIIAYKVRRAHLEGIGGSS
jgi:ABC-2 type transport system permease protein